MNVEIEFLFLACQPGSLCRSGNSFPQTVGECSSVISSDLSESRGIKNPRRTLSSSGVLHAVPDVGGIKVPYKYQDRTSSAQNLFMNAPRPIFSTGTILILYGGVVSSELKSLEYRIQPCRQGLVYRLRSVGWIEAWVHTRLDPPIATFFSPTALVKQFVLKGTLAS
uniref:Uncharacterized protein n=1 Tax=Glossina palpalis gambiensis TaxID=67801 RepID=A0A1B0BEM1_9MUSC